MYYSVMGPIQFAKYLCRIAAKIDNSKTPSRTLVAKDINRAIKLAYNPTGSKYDEFTELMTNIEGQGYGCNDRGTFSHEQTLDYWKDYTGKTWNMQIDGHDVTVKGIGPRFTEQRPESADNFNIEVLVDGSSVFKGGAVTNDEPLEAVTMAIDG